VGKSTFIGLVFGFGMLIVGYMMDKGNVGSLLLLSPAVIVIGGTVGALIISFSIKDVAKLPKLIKEAGTDPQLSLNDTMETILDLATKVKREGILSLEKVVHEEEFKKKNDPLLVRGSVLLMDGLDKQVLKEILDSEIYIYEQLKKREIGLFEQAGGFSPTLGIIGTVMGLIQVLGNMDSPEELAASIATAFTATLYGVCLANLVYLPIANKLKLRLKLLLMGKELINDGLLAINDFESPMSIRERLAPYVMLDEKPPKNKKPEEDARQEQPLQQREVRE
jgi:chemotaxis protein MotA